jgi:hypothetical protein
VVDAFDPSFNCSVFRNEFAHVRIISRV